MLWIIYILAFVIGICVGSFTNVLVDRFDNKKLSWSKGRSVCDHCNRQLRWWENIPLLSFIFLKGKCRTCHSPIPFEYFLVEGLTGILSVLTVYFLNLNGVFSIVSSLIITFLLVIILVFDCRYMIIPDWAIIFLVVLSVVVNYLQVESFLKFVNSFLIPGLAGAGFLGLLHLITKGKGMGLGDVKFALFMGLFLGFPRVVVAFYVAFLTGALIGVILILMGKKRFRQTIPFGPFLVLGTFVAWIWGLDLVNLFFIWTKKIAVFL